MIQYVIAVKLFVELYRSLEDRQIGISVDVVFIRYDLDSYLWPM